MKVIQSSPYQPSEISRVGIAVPAVVDNVRGTIHRFVDDPPKPRTLAKAIGDQLGTRVTIENEMVCMARGEHWFGRAQGLDTFTLFRLGLAVGSADYVDGLPRFGSNGFNPEFAHIKTSVDVDAPPCFCGSTGCLGATSSTWAIAHAAGKLPKLSVESVVRIDEVFGDVLDLVEAGNPSAVAAVDRAALHFGAAVSNSINGTDPSHVIILIADDRLRRAIEAKILSAIAERTLPAILSKTQILIDVVNEDWPLKGAAALALEKVFVDDE